MWGRGGPSTTLDIFGNIEFIEVRKASETGYVASKVVRGRMEKREIRELVNKTPQLRRTQAKAIEKNRCYRELLILPQWFRTVEAKVGRLAADVVAGPRVGHVFGVGRDGALKALDDDVRPV
uniref:Uncharacterized protein n=1 Tax=Arundo donax TaxID=35708 RepID=A0A0A9EMD1_ARUDO